MQKVSELVSRNIGDTLTNMRTWKNVMYNVLENGLVGDGTTDDTAALQTLINTAIAAGRRAIFFPHTPTGGQYYVTSLTNADQVDFIGDNCSFVGGYAGTIQNMGAIAELSADYAKQVAKVFNVEGYGAVGDWNGTTGTDDTAAFKSALTAAESAGGGIIYAPKQYRITEPLTLKMGTTIVGEGISNSMLAKDYVESTPNSGFIIMDATNNSGGLKDIALFCVKPGGAAVALVAVAIDAPDFITLDHVYITGSDNQWNYCVYVDGSLRSSAPQGVRDMKIVNCDLFHASTAIAFFKGFNNATVLGTGFYGTGASKKVILAGAPGFASNFFNADCTVLHTIEIASSDTVNNVLVKCPLIDTVNTGSLAFNVTVIGTVTNKQENWNSGIYIGPGGSVVNGGLINRKGGDFYSQKTSPSGNSAINYVGQHSSVSVPNGAIFTFTCPSSKFFSVYRAGGQAALCFADYASATISLLSNPSNMFENSSTPASSKIGIFKTANDHVISIKNNMGSADNINVCFYGGTISAVTDPA